MSKTFNDLKVGDEVAVLGWFDDRDKVFGSDNSGYGIRRCKVSGIDLYPLHPSVTGMIRRIETNEGSFKDVSKNCSMHLEDPRFGSKKFLYINEEDIRKKEIEIKEKEIEEVTKHLEELKQELNKFKI